MPTEHQTTVRATGPLHLPKRNSLEKAAIEAAWVHTKEACGCRWVGQEANWVGHAVRWVGQAANWVGQEQVDIVEIYNWMNFVQTTGGRSKCEHCTGIGSGT